MSPSEPRFKIGDAVTAFNGEPRVVTSMRWSHEDIDPDVSPRPEPRHWGWVLKTVHPDDQECVGEGLEMFYRPRTLR